MWCCVSSCHILRGGKSYFASLLFGTPRDNIFDLGHTTKSHTQGIWCALQDRGDHVLMVVDSEGTNAASSAKGRVRASLSLQVTAEPVSRSLPTGDFSITVVDNCCTSQWTGHQV
jgi:hypothetical protein